MSAFDTIAASGAFEPLDLHFARMIRRRAGRDDAGADLVALTAALLSHQRSRGHSCIDLRDWAGRPFPTEGGFAPEVRQRNTVLPPLPDAQTWRQALADSALVGDADHADREPPSPLVRDAAGRLYLARYWRAEQRLAANLRQRLESTPPVIDARALTTLFRQLFPEVFHAPPSGVTDDQAIAATTALASRVTLISGGPGTGKTTTVGRVLALLLATDPKLRIALAAPTGKAAARLGEAVAEQAERLPIDEQLRARLPPAASTLHRLLGYQPLRDRFRHRAGRPLATDVLVIDEVSMVDLLLMDAAICALPPAARVILLGDKDQLTSVETGSVFGDLCAAADLGVEASHDRVPRLSPGRSPRFAELYRALSGQRPAVRDPTGRDPAGERPTGPPGEGQTRQFLQGAAVELTISYRFRDQPGISELAANLRRGDAGRALEVLDDPRFGEVGRLDPPETTGAALAPVLEPLNAYLAASSPAEALERLSGFRVLCARRQGSWGVERLNVAVERHLAASGHPSRASGISYPARPILITANDYQLKLFNGDLGVCWAGPEGRLWAFFAGSGDEPRRLPLARLPPHETAWAMTVHKSQGSEFGRVLLVLGDTDSRVLTRELLYTGATRARRSVVIVASAKVFRGAVARRGRRVSGLADALSGPPLWKRGVRGDFSATPTEPPAPPEPSPESEPTPEPQPQKPDDDGQLSLFR